MRGRSALAAGLVLIAVGLAAACGTDDAAPASRPTATAEPPSVDVYEIEVLAPIENAQILIAESFPEQYFLSITSGLPNACVEYSGYELTRSNESFKVTVKNLEPAPDQNVACAEIYRTQETNIRLGDGNDFSPGTEYAVHVNDFTTSFVTAEAFSQDEVVQANFAEEFDLLIGRSALISGGGPVIEFKEVVEESRCPIGVRCIQAGRARLLISVGGRDLTLEVENIDPEANVADAGTERFLVEALALEPYPRDGADVDRSSVLATLVVTKMLSVGQALNEPDGTVVSVEGFVVAAPDRSVRLCEGLLESFPPQCDRPSLELEAVDLDAVDGLRTEQNVTWSDDYVMLTGTRSGEALVVE